MVRRRSSYGLSAVQSRGQSAGNSDHEDTGSDDNLEKEGGSCNNLDVGKCIEEVEEENNPTVDGQPSSQEEENGKKKHLKKLMKLSNGKRKQPQKQYSMSCSALPDDIGTPSVAKEPNPKCTIL